jgi:hypothetical protein
MEAHQVNSDGVGITPRSNQLWVIIQSSIYWLKLDNERLGDSVSLGNCS